ncbi:MAG TPA: cation-translocating P-type ATPase [Kiloniellales bacterium]|nr:cation-translocating P-type ATPase [Kiloniellales bacterium]
MTCCRASAGQSPSRQAQPEFPADSARDELLLSSRELDRGQRLSELSVPSVHCAGCIRTIEEGLSTLEGVLEARVNLTGKRVAVRWEGEKSPPLIEALKKLGYDAHPWQAIGEKKDPVLGQLIRAMAVAGFASSNIMLLSVAVWSGAEAGARDIFHLISAVIALPVLLYSGRIFYRSAWSALRHGRTNMDVPISVGITLAFSLSLYDTLRGGPHAYFDGVVMLLFFLLIGRTLDHLMREKARSAVKSLARLAARGALVEQADGSRAYLPVEQIAVGNKVFVAAGERIPVDAEVISGASDLDVALVTGESDPLPVGAGAELQAGTLNLTGPLILRAMATAEQSFLSEMVRLMEAAEAGRSTYRRIADRVARHFAPVVHSLAFMSFLGWMVASGDLHRALTIAVTVLIITCPCALGLSVPMVQVVAARRLFEGSILVKDGSGLERLAEIDTVVFDKTGTLTLGRPLLQEQDSLDSGYLELAVALAVHSRHPHSRALVEAHPAAGRQEFEDVRELPGFGVEARLGADLYRLGLASWALADDDARQAAARKTVLSRNGRLLAAYSFSDPLRPEAAATIRSLAQKGLNVEILSGDHEAAVEAVAREIGVKGWRAGMRPADKTARLTELAEAGHKVLMVGDGLNDAPALAAAHVSMAPANAADVGRNAADLVFLGESLDAVPKALLIAQRSARLIRQNFGLSFSYNAIALPFAVLGFVTPLFAAVAMSLSSVVVVLNALRLNGGQHPESAHSRTGGRQRGIELTPELVR